MELNVGLLEAVDAALRCPARITWMFAEKEPRTRKGGGGVALFFFFKGSFYACIVWVSLIVRCCFSALGSVAGSPASVDECEWMVNDRPRCCQSISGVVWPALLHSLGDKICVILP